MPVVRLRRPIISSQYLSARALLCAGQGADNDNRPEKGPIFRSRSPACFCYHLVPAGSYLPISHLRLVRAPSASMMMKYVPPGNLATGTFVTYVPPSTPSRPAIVRISLP